MADEPAVTPITLPPEPVSETPALVDQLPPDVASLNDNTLPVHTTLPPRIAAGLAYTLTTTFALQPVIAIYDMILVPATRPVTSPEASTVAFVVFELVHVPPLILFVKTVVSPAHTACDPPITGD